MCTSIADYSSEWKTKSDPNVNKTKLSDISNATVSLYLINKFV